MRIGLTAEKIKGLSPATLKKIAALLSKHIKQTGNGTAHIAVLSPAKMRVLNNDWRGKDKPTNVLSYPQFPPTKVFAEAKKSKTPLYLGDIILCLPVITREARELKKPVNHHLIHLVVHGVLHLLGYDHATSRDASTMEKREKAILSELGLPDPYVLPPALKKMQKRKRA
jgi:probable rRNA maturation factor